MKFHFSWKLGVGFSLFVLAMIYNEYRIRSIEGFGQLETMMQNLKNARDDSIALGSYSWWTAWLYAHPETSSVPLNDFKSRVFQPNCKFRTDWATNLPPGMLIPPVPQNVDLANIGYKTYIDGIATKKPHALAALNDARKRFMEPDCQFLNPSDTSSYNQNYSPVFK
jgi:hypothetical protein